MLEGSFKDAVAASLQLNLRTYAGGADAVAHSLMDGSLRADVFLPITAAPMLTVLRAGKAREAQPFARTEMVILYSPKSRFAARFDAAAQGKDRWWEVLQEPGIRLARSNPASDPSGRSILSTLMLAAKKYGQPDLVQKVLGPTLNPEQVGHGGNVMASLQSGQLDAIGSYKIGAASAHLPYIALPDEINLSESDLHARDPELQLVIENKVFHTEPLIFYAAVLQDAANPKAAAAFGSWLKGREAQDLLHAHQYASAGAAPDLHA